MTTRFGRVGALALIGSVLCIMLATPARAQCTGDCNGTGVVQINELILGVNISLGLQPLDACTSFDCLNTGNVPIACLIRAVNNSLNGCPATPTATMAGTATATIPAPTATSTGGVVVNTPTATVAGPTPTATTGGPAECGNNQVEGEEQCDGTDLGICPEGAGCFPADDENECECSPSSCAPVDGNSGGSATSGTFTVQSTGAPQTGDRYCGGLALANAFVACESDADCGDSPGACTAVPWLGVATFAPFPITSVITTFNASEPDAKCVHQATIPCVGTSTPCPGTPKLAESACCTEAGFKVDTFFISALGFCSRVDQTACGSGLVDSSVPMLGDYDIVKVADTTTPAGPNCTYDGTETHPACSPAAEDTQGTIVTTIGDGEFDAEGGHSLFTIPQRSVTWVENSAPPCSPEDTYDGSDTLITNFTLNLATTTASATASYVDSTEDNDDISFCGFGPPAFNGIAQGKPDTSGQGAVTVAVGAALSGGGPTYDLLFSSVTAVTSPMLVEDAPDCTPPPGGCPE